MPKKILLSGYVGGYDFGLEKLKNFLEDAGGEDIIAEINSGGGAVFQGLALSNLIRNYQGKTECRLIGICASMATYFALAFDKVVAEDDAVFMIHNPSGMVYGDQNDMAKMQKTLESIAELIANRYAAKCGRPKATLRAEMDDETYFFGNEIKKAGFVDEIAKGKGKEKKAAIDEAELAIIAAMEEAHKEKVEVEKIAAYLPDVDPGGVDVHNSLTREDSANQDESNEEVNMDLKTFLAENSEARKEYDSAIEAARKEGADSKQTEVDAVLPFLTSDYPDKVKAQIPKVLSGEVSAEMFKMAVSMLDLKNEDDNSTEADKETKEQGSTPAESKKENETEEAYQARLQKMKARLGKEV
jgi:ATP-dependent protease ClpP protease subunit